MLIKYIKTCQICWFFNQKFCLQMITYSSQKFNRYQIMDRQSESQKEVATCIDPLKRKARPIIKPSDYTLNMECDHWPLWPRHRNTVLYVVSVSRTDHRISSNRFDSIGAVKPLRSSWIVLNLCALSERSRKIWKIHLAPNIVVVGVVHSFSNTYQINTFQSSRSQCL